MHKEETREEGPCETCECKTEELQAVRQRHMAEMREARQRYQSEMETLRRDLHATIAEKDEEIDHLQNENRILRGTSLEHNTKTSCTTGTSAVASAIKNILTGKSFIFSSIFSYYSIITDEFINSC